MRRVRRRLPAARPQACKAGFTLLEVLLTAILSATLLAGLWSLFGTYLRLFESGQARVERAQLVRALSRQISNDLHGVVAPKTRPRNSSDISPLDAGPFGSTSASVSLDVTTSPAMPSGRDGDAADREGVPRFSLVGNRRILRLEVLQPASVIDMLQPAEPLADVVPGESRPRATGLRTVLYSFEPPREVSESDREPPPGLLRREQTWEQVQASATGMGTQASSSQSAEETELGRGFASLTPLDVREADQFDDSVIWTPEVIAMRFRYYDGVAWFDEWDSRERKSLPVAVEIAMRFDSADQSRRPAPPIRPSIDEDSSMDEIARPASADDLEDGDISDEAMDFESSTAGPAESDESGAPIIRELVLLQSPPAKRNDAQSRFGSVFSTTSTEGTSR